MPPSCRALQAGDADRPTRAHLHGAEACAVKAGLYDRAFRCGARGDVRALCAQCNGEGRVLIVRKELGSLPLCAKSPREVSRGM